MLTTLLLEYLKALTHIRSSGEGVAETSYYPALSNLLNGIGQSLKPDVRVIINIKNRGAGIPDGGFFTPEQLSEGSPLEGQLPSRGALEVKGTVPAQHLQLGRVCLGTAILTFRQGFVVGTQQCIDIGIYKKTQVDDTFSLFKQCTG